MEGQTRGHCVQPPSARAGRRRVRASGACSARYVLSLPIHGALGYFSDPEYRFLEENEARLYVSAVSIWEMRLKHHARRRSRDRMGTYDPNDVVAALEEQNVKFLALTIKHAAQELATPLAHKDPFDELLLVQAQEEDLRLLTTDRLLVDHPLAITV